MANLEDRLRDDLTSAIRARDELTAATLRMALTATKNEAVSGEVARELTDDEVLRVLGREAKKRREAATAYADAGRAELAARERAELDVLARYLPEPLTDAELIAIVAAAVEQQGAAGQGRKAMGAVMKVVTAEVAGRADSSRVAAAVMAALDAG